MKKGIIVFILALFIGVSAWYFFIKPYDFRVRFESNNPQAIIYKSLLSNHDSTYTNIEEEKFSNLKQELNFKDSVFILNWIILRKNDTLHAVELYAKDKQHSFYQKFKALFTKTDFSRRIVNIAKAKQQQLDVFKEKYRLSAIDTSTLNVPYYVYIQRKSTNGDKAHAMISSIFEPMGYVKEHEYKLAGDPFLTVNQWNPYSDSIQFNFGFPLPTSNDYPEKPPLSFGENFEIKGLHCTFNGDYRYSDTAWYYLWEYAQNNNIATENQITEVYRNDPHSGGQPIEWSADIYLPLTLKN